LAPLHSQAGVFGRERRIHRFTVGIEVIGARPDASGEPLLWVTPGASTRRADRGRIEPLGACDRAAKRLFDARGGSSVNVRDNLRRQWRFATNGPRFGAAYTLARDLQFAGYVDDSAHR